MKRSKLLIIDDEPYIHDLIEEVLEVKGENCQILNAFNGEEGTLLYKEHNPLLTLLDVDMPIMDGIQFLKHIDCRTNKKCPVVIMSGLVSGEEEELCLELGAEMFMGKPFTIMSLIKIFGHYFEHKNRTQQ